MLENMVGSLFTYQQIRTTWPKAKEAQKLADQLITLGKANTLHAKRRAFAVLGNRELTTKLFAQIAPRFQNRKGGYTRVLHHGTRNGDSAPLALLELTEKQVVEKKEPVKKSAKAAPHAHEHRAHEKEAEPKEKAAKPDVSKKPAAQPKKGFFGNIRTLFGRRGMGE